MSTLKVLNWKTDKTERQLNNENAEMESIKQPNKKLRAEEYNS